jgi:hypothetical protein
MAIYHLIKPHYYLLQYFTDKFAVIPQQTEPDDSHKLDLISNSKLRNGLSNVPWQMTSEWECTCI